MGPLVVSAWKFGIIEFNLILNRMNICLTHEQLLYYCWYNNFTLEYLMYSVSSLYENWYRTLMWVCYLIRRIICEALMIQNYCLCDSVHYSLYICIYVYMYILNKFIDLDDKIGAIFHWFIDLINHYRY